MKTLLRRILARLARRTPPEAAPAPGDHYLTCQETGQRMPLLRRHIRETFGMSPEEYRKKWGLPEDYPMVSRAYAERRKAARSMKFQG
ncbi:MucR family transcriptional regulator [Salipiger abyssi]|uniref:ROS/MUCR transcriptional regulator protein n=1 Tax=Salipiger abyssi TaxID=1250539 RepID=A0A1P8ULS9_9RHOB|nr:MucR family transcriptional regulator [Salipiger abyssi]APZ50351.1 ROS/MUCR transcriptional regulator protein [Salipiger abyssi]